MDAPEVARIIPARVELSIARSDVECPEPRGVYGVTPARWGRRDVADDDRLEVVEALKAAYCADMPDADELGERVTAAYTVGTLEELEAPLAGGAAVRAGAARLRHTTKTPPKRGPRALACHGRSRTRTWDLFLIREAL
jgi:hypothetical protein